MGKAENAEVIAALHKLKDEVGKSVHVERMLLFGSRAKGEELLTSDADVLVVSKDFEKTTFKKRPDKFLENWTLPIDLEVLCYTPEEYSRKTKEIGIVSEAEKTGMII